MLTSPIAFAGRERRVCHSGRCFVMASKNERKAGLPKRDPVSRGGFDATRASASSSMETIVLVVGVKLSLEMEEMAFPCTESESENTKARRVW